MKGTLERIGCGEMQIIEDGRGILDEISLDNADSVPEKLKCWIDKINR